MLNINQRPKMPCLGSLPEKTHISAGYENMLISSRTTFIILLDIMIESVFRDMVKNRLIKDLLIEETLPRKGKPALKETGTTTVWVVNVLLSDDTSFLLESARGGAREWASLSNLDKWLKACGVLRYTVKHAPRQALQQTLAFNGVH